MKTPANDSLNQGDNSRPETQINLPSRVQEEVHAPKEGHENEILKLQNEELKLEYLAMKEALKNPGKSIREHKLLLENTRANEEHRRTTGYLKLATSAMDELFKLGISNAPLWNKNTEGGVEKLNFEEYARAFPFRLGTKPLRFVSDATRASSVVPMNSSTLVEAFLNPDQWKEMFMGIIGSCTTLEVISNATGDSRHGTLQLMKAEIQLISPLVSARVMKFIRFTKQQAEGLWIVVDLSIGNGMDRHLTRRRPSGCIIQDMPNGLSMVTWIEHAEYDEQLVSQQYRRLISSGVGFGAPRWIAALLRHCDSLRAITSPTLNTHLFEDTKQSCKCLTQRMKSIFCAGVCLTGDQQWDLVAVAPGKPRIMARKCITGLGEPLGIVMVASYSFWIPTNHQHLFGLLVTKAELRCMWDPICHKIATESMISFPLSEDESNRNCVWILHSDTPIEDENQIMVLQEASSDMTGSLLVYSSVDFPTVSLVMNGKDASSATLLPSGICIVPGYGEGGVCAPGGERGSMVTVGYQILHPDEAISNISMETVDLINDLVSRTVMGIKEMAKSSRQ